MGKKNKSYFKSSKKKSGKKSKKSDGWKKNGKYYDKPKLKSVRPTLDKKEVKKNKKTVLNPVEVPKDFRKNRLKCNHAGRIMSVSEYRNMTPTYAAYTPALERMVQLYGEENCCICRDCYDVLVKRREVTKDAVNDALTTLYAACNVAVANKRLKDDEVKEIAKLKGIIDDFRPVLDIIDQVEDIPAQEDDGDGADASADPSSLNRMNGAAFVP